MEYFQIDERFTRISHRSAPDRFGTIYDMVLLAVLFFSDTEIAFIRSCSTTDAEDHCQDIRPPIKRGNPDKICLETCNFDGCNPAVQLAPPTQLLMLLTAPLILLVTLSRLPASKCT